MIRVAMVGKDRGLSGEGEMLVISGIDSEILRRAHLDQIQVMDVQGAIAFASGGLGASQVTRIPEHAALYQNAPNPFNPSTTIPYAVPEASFVQLTIYSPLGQEVRTLIRDFHEPGFHRVIWDGRDNLGRSVGSGLYLYRFKVGKFVDVKKALLLK